MKHTQGEWKLERDHFDNHIIFCDGFHLAEIRSIADAKLIAAAPELLYALNDCIKTMEAITILTGHKPCIERAKAAIKKATM
jgi:hypothetical protein